MSKVSEQQIASDPALSIWLSASAGTGKTKVLTDRVLRLLIKEVDARKILCLTFTNAAANEMKERLYHRISKWASSCEQELKLQLEMLTGQAPTNKEIARAKNLLSQYLQTSNNLNIYTIHSFCQKILKQFPLEAGISPSFKIIDELGEQKNFSLIKQALIIDPLLERLNTAILGQMHETKFDELIGEILEQKIKFKYLFEKFTAKADYKNYLQETLKLDDLDTFSYLRQTQVLLAKYQQEIAIPDFAFLISQYVVAKDESQVKETFYHLKNAFLTKDDQKKKKLLTKKLQDSSPKQARLLNLIQEIIFEAQDYIKTIHLLQSSLKLYELAKAVIEKYQAHKLACGFLDYDDLIYHAHNLLSKSEHKDWILYKLDGGIEHILVDEAQDTSIYQWSLILTLLSDFVAGESSAQEQKSIFIVGDEKQSIYSFQGAEYHQFNNIKAEILSQLLLAKKDHRVVNLTTSYRSSSIILEAVERIFKQVRAQDPLLFQADNFALSCYLENFGGSIELWDVHKNQDKPEIFWPILLQDDLISSKAKLAVDIAKYIKETLDSKKILFSTKNVVEPQDFMILLRQRNDFALLLVKELKSFGLPVSGLDRISLFEDLSVQDLLSAAKFALLPPDELNLACLLRSALINISPACLYELCYQRQGNLYTQIYSNPKYCDISRQLDSIKSLAQRVSISDFFHILVYVNNNLAKFLSINGQESLDSINELISLALKFEQEISGNMQAFILWCSNLDIQINRDASSGGVIKIMTVHASKGLQSPIVILPDTTGLPNSRSKFLWDQRYCPFFAFSASKHNRFYDNLKEEESQKQYKEYLRLLYVGVTRAQEQLIVCGSLGSNNIDEKCWYSIMRNALQESLTRQEKPNLIIFHKQSALLPPLATLKPPTDNDMPLMPVINVSLAARTQVLKQEVLNFEANSPLVTEKSAYYGKIVHKILEDSINKKDLSMLVTHDLLSLLPEYYRVAILPELDKLKLSDEFKQLLQEEVKTEVNIGNTDKLSRIDLLCVFHDKIIIVDYKTDKILPKSISQVPKKYLQQLLNYKEAIEQIYPNKKVEAKILWLMHADFMQIF
jgi:ATP-dependent helicase/nuclease subunit A